MNRNRIIITLLILTYSCFQLSACVGDNTAQKPTEVTQAEPTTEPTSEPTADPTPEPTPPPTLYEKYHKKSALSVVKIKGHSKKEIKKMFYSKRIPDKVWDDMQGKSYHEGCPVPRSGLRLLRVLYYGYDEKTHIGEMIVAKRVADEFLDIFYKLFRNKYQINKIQRIDAYDGDDDASIADDNTSCFNYRVVEGSTHLSKHSYGIAIDINPLPNPYVHKVNGHTEVSPPAGEKYADRSRDFKHKIDHEDLCYKLFHVRGYKWGGDWISMKDYQHFQKM